MARDDPPSDEALIQAINRGDVHAFETLYYRYRDWVAGLARRFTDNDADALDVLQETFAYLHRKAGRLRLDARMTTFLYPVVRNLSLALRRKRRPALLEADLFDAFPAPTADRQKHELHALVARLPPAQREVLLMRFVDDMSIDEIAAALSIPPGTVKSRLHNALAALRGDANTRKYFE